MYIKIKKDKHETIKDVFPGDLFTVNGELYVKLDKSVKIYINRVKLGEFSFNKQPDEKVPANAIAIRTGMAVEVLPEAIVKRVKGIEIEI